MKILSLLKEHERWIDCIDPFINSLPEKYKQAVILADYFIIVNCPKIYHIRL